MSKINAVFHSASLFLMGMLLVLAACEQSSNKKNLSNDLGKYKEAHRIVSMAPSITELLFSIGLGPKIVGVTRYCKYPPQAQSIPNLGGYLDPNFEQLIQMNPDVVVLFREHQKLQTQLKKFNIPFLEIKNEGIRDIFNSLDSLGHWFDQKEITDSIRLHFQNEIQKGKKRCIHKKKRTGKRIKRHCFSRPKYGD